MHTFLDHFTALRRQRVPAALATVVGVENGSSKRIGSRMWVTGDGEMLGSLTVGGCVDGRARDEALHTLADGRPRRFEVDLGEEGLDFGMSCAGTVDVYVEFMDLGDDDAPAVQALERVLAEVANGRRAVLVTPLGGTPYVMTADSHEHELLESEEAGCAFVPGAGGEPDLLYQSFVPPRRLIVVGAAPIADPLVRMAKMLGFHVVVVDGKEDRLAGRFAEADERLFGIPSEIVARLELDARTAVVLTAHDYRYEVPVLRELLQREILQREVPQREVQGREPAYVGFVASRRRGGAVLDFLTEAGVEGVERVHVPVGLDIGAMTPAEIAVSILAEIVAEREGATCLPLTSLRFPETAGTSGGTNAEVTAAAEPAADPVAR